MTRIQSLLLATLATAALAGCGVADGECADGADNDGDGRIDGKDDACAAGGDHERDEQASNGPDSGSTVASCKDGIDNDGDGKTDFPADPGCQLSLDADETDDCPDGPACPACGNGLDDDGDELSDFPGDPGCDSGYDDDEFNYASTACGTDVIGSLGADGSAAGTIVPAGDSEVSSPTCGGQGAEKVYLASFDHPVALELSTDFAETSLDTVLYVRTECRSAESELACSADVADRRTSRLSLQRLEPGDYYLVVDAQNIASGGDFRLQVDELVARGELCDAGTTVCAAGLSCRRATPTATSDTCEPPICSDGYDWDGDGDADYPNDPGCDGPDDQDEADGCPGATCPVCADGLDNDGDGLRDFPSDHGCSAASNDAEVDCADGAQLVSLRQGTTTGNTVGSGDDKNPSCGSSGGPEVMHRLVVPGKLATLRIDTAGSAFDTILTIKQGACTVADLACNDDSNDVTSEIVLSNLAKGVYFISVDGYSGDAGDYALHVVGTIIAGQACNPTTIASGLFRCVAGTACTGGVCKPAP